MKVKKETIALAAFFTFFALFTTFGADFKAFRKNASRTGLVTEQAYPELILKWKYTTQGAITSSPIVYNGVVYFGNSAGDVWAFEAYKDTPVVKWQYSTEGKIISSLAAYNGIVYAASQDGNLYAFNADTGDIKWQYQLIGSSCSSPVIYNNMLFCAGGHPKKEIYCLDAGSGYLIWKKELGQYVYSSPVVYNGVLYVGANDGKLYSLDAYTGEIKWFFQTKGGVYLSTPTISPDGSVLYFAPGNDDRRIYALDLNKNGELKSGWQLIDYGTFPTLTSSIAISNNTIYFVSGVNPCNLYAVDASNGTKKWERSIGIASNLGFVSSPTIVNDIIYIGSSSSNLYCIDIIDGSIKDFYTLDAPILSTPAVSNGWIFIGTGDTGDGTIYAFKSKKITAISSPEEDSVVSGTVDIKGIIENPNFLNYKLEYSVGNTNNWIQIESAKSNIPSDNKLGSLNTLNLPEGNLFIKLTVTDGSSTNNTAVIGYYVSNVYAQGLVSAYNGGNVLSSDGTEVIFEPGTLNEDDTVTIEKPSTFPQSGVPSNFKPTEVVREFKLTKASNATFNKLVTIKIPYTEESVSGMKKENLRIGYWNTTKGKWQILNSSQVSPNENKVIGKVSHFSLYRIFEYVPGSSELLSKDTVYTYPNPALGDEVYFKCYLGQNADVIIDVFNIAGEKIAHLENSGFGGTGLDTKWDIKNVASGVYVYKLEAISKSTGEKKYVTKKLAIIH
jgi:outer membrane protein assembly factor BamB